MAAPESRAAAIAWAREVVADSWTVYLDTETTGIGPDAEIVDIAILDADGEVLLDRLVKPTGPIPAESSAVHGITDAMVADAPSWPELFPTVFNLLLGRRVVIFNADYDRGVISGCGKRHGLPDIGARWQCAMKAHADFKATPGRRPGSFRWWKLSDAAADLGIEPGTHRALADTIACREVVLRMAAGAEPSVVRMASPEALRDLRRAAMLKHHLSSDQLITLTGPLDAMRAADAAAWLAYFEATSTLEVRQRLAIASLPQPPLFTDPVPLDPDRFTR